MWWLWSLVALGAAPQHLRIASEPPMQWSDLSSESLPVRLWWDVDDEAYQVQLASGGRWQTLATDAQPGWTSPPVDRGAALRVGRAGQWATPVYVPTWVSPTDLARLSGPRAAVLAGVVGQIDVSSEEGTVWASTLGGGLLSISAAGDLRTYTKWDGLPDDQVIAVDVHGERLLVGTAAGAVLFNQGVPSRVWDEALPDGHAQAVLLTDEQVLVGTSGGLVEVFAERVVSDGPPAVYSMAAARGGGAWVGMGGLRFRPADGAPVGEVVALDGDHIYGIIEQEDGLVVASQEHGVLRGSPPSIAAMEGMPTSGAFGLAQAVDGIWVAAGEQGLLGPLGQAYGFRDGLPGRFVWSLAVGRGASLWVGTDRGVARLSPGPVDQPPRVERQPLAHWPVTEAVEVVLPVKRGVWVGGSRGVWALGKPHRSVHNLTVAGPQQTRVLVEGGGYTWAIGQRVVRMDRRGRLAALSLRERVLSAAWSRESLWLGTGEGIQRLDPVQMTVEPWVKLDGVTRLVPTERGFWALAEGTPVLVIGRISRPYMMQRVVHDLAQVGDGVCLATDGGLVVLFPDGDQLDPLGEGGSGLHVSAVSASDDGGCWYASSTGRVGRISAADAHVKRQLPLTEGTEVRRIVADGDWAWVVTQRGTWRVWLPAP